MPANIINQILQVRFESNFMYINFNIFEGVMRLGFMLKILGFVFTTPAFSQKYYLNIHRLSKDTSIRSQSLQIQTNFRDRNTCSTYIQKIPDVLLQNGYPAASVDSFHFSLFSADIWLYLGPHYPGINLKLDSAEKKIKYISQLLVMADKKGYIPFNAIKAIEKNIIHYYMSSGYPFAEVSIDKFHFGDMVPTGILRINKGPVYHIDSIRQYGKLKLNNQFFQHYLSIFPGSQYNLEKFNSVEKRLRELPYVNQIQKPDISMLGSGAVLNLYLDSKKSNQFNIVIGYIPPASGKSTGRLTGDIDINLKNTLKAGESFVLNWQQLQKQSPKLKLGFQQPFIFNTSLGIDVNFDLLKRDSSFVQLNSQLGIIYLLSNRNSGKIFIQKERSYLLQGGYDTNKIRIFKILPQNIDFTATSIGINYQYSNTDYRYNPRKGNELNFIASAGLKKINYNNDILNLKDTNAPNFKFRELYDSLGNKNYQLHGLIFASNYLPSGKQSVLKSSINIGIVNSRHLFRNELYLIGGYRILRGFDEESIYASQYVVLTNEYRYLTGQNSYLYIFNDVAFTKTHFQNFNSSNSFISTGLGVSFETKAGLLNFNYAIGKRNDVKFNITEASKIHFGFINFF